MNTETSVESQTVFSNSKMATNMPFSDGTTMVFCQSSGTATANVHTAGTIWKRVRQNPTLAERMKKLPRIQPVTYRPWKLAYCNWNDKITRAISTGLPAHRPERSPAFYYDGNQIHLSFISGGPTTTGFHYRLYSCSGPDLEHLEPPKVCSDRPTFFGFVSPHHICWGTMNVIQMSEKATGRNFRLRTSFHRVASVTFMADNPAKLVITGLIDKEHHSQTILYDLATANVSKVSAGSPTYKSSMYRNQIVFAQKRKDSFEARELCYGEYSLSPSAIQISKEQ